MIRVKVPLDLHSVADAGSSAFAAATPMRVRDLVALAVREAIGLRAPADKFARSVGRTIAGLIAGDFTLSVDGRSFSNPDSVVMCDRATVVRFFLTSPARQRQASTR